MTEENKTEVPSDSIRLETENIFDSVGYPMPQAGEFIDNPMAALMQPLIQYFEAIKPKTFEPIKSEHKVKIFRLNDRTVLAEVEAKIQTFLNEGYCCHMPTVVNDFVIMDFARRKDDERQERQANNDGSDKGGEL
jgi:hypothetical protein